MQSGFSSKSGASKTIIHNDDDDVEEADEEKDAGSQDSPNALVEEIAALSIQSSDSGSNYKFDLYLVCW